MLIKLLPRDWKTQLKRIKHRVDEDNGKSIGIGNEWYQKFICFPEMNFGRTLVVSFQLLPLVLGYQGCGISNII